VIFKPYYYFETGCAAYVFGCGGLGKCAVVDAHERDIDAYVEFAASKGMRITHDIGVARPSAQGHAMMRTATASPRSSLTRRPAG
jgi:hypothetical protein